MKRIVTVQDISCVGKCSLTVALPVISAMGVETSVIPTAVLSTHTAFKNFTFEDLTSNITPVCEHWKNEKFHFDAIYTGYLGSFEQINLMHNFIEEFGKTDTLTIVDPCMADFGKLYSGFTKEFALEMAKLCSKANVILPNMTEASFLLDVPYIEKGYSVSYIKDLLKKLASLGPKKVILKGVEFDKDSIENESDESNELKGLKNCDGKIGIAAYDSEQNRFSWYFHKKMPQNFHGTGDIFASVFTGAITRGIPFEQSYSLAADFVVESIKYTLEDKNGRWYGVNFESAFPYLIERLGKYKIL